MGRAAPSLLACPLVCGLKQLVHAMKVPIRESHVTSHHFCLAMRQFQGSESHLAYSFTLPGRWAWCFGVHPRELSVM